MYDISTLIWQDSTQNEIHNRFIIIKAWGNQLIISVACDLTSLAAPAARFITYVVAAGPGS